MERRPILTIIAGANGAGKSTIARALESPGEFVNGDVVAKLIDAAQPERVSVAAGRRVVRRLDELIRSRNDFAYETTLSSRQSLAIMRAAKDTGYQVDLVFVVLRERELNVRRVAERVLAGGHHVDPDIIRRRFDSSIDNLAQAIALAEATIVFDNSSLKGPVEILRIVGGRIIASSLRSGMNVHRRILAAFRASVTLREEKSWSEP